MKKSLFLLLALVIVLGGCGSKPAVVKQAQPEKLSGSIEELMAKNKSLKCDLIAKADAVISSGTTYIADGKARVDYKNKMGSVTVTSHMINDGTWLYTWTEEYPGQALKMKLDALPKEANLNTNAPQAEKAGVENYQAQYDYNCFTWVKDNAMFTPPANVNFQDYTKMMQSVQGFLGNTNASGNAPKLNTATMCALCNNISDASGKAACRKQLGCK